MKQRNSYTGGTNSFFRSHSQDLSLSNLLQFSREVAGYSRRNRRASHSPLLLHLLLKTVGSILEDFSKVEASERLHLRESSCIPTTIRFVIIIISRSISTTIIPKIRIDELEKKINNSETKRAPEFTSLDFWLHSCIQIIVGATPTEKRGTKTVVVVIDQIHDEEKRIKQSFEAERRDDEVEEGLIMKPKRRRRETKMTSLRQVTPSTAPCRISEASSVSGATIYQRRLRSESHRFENRWNR
ncbi:unnamed protein product [Vicia faba]|uniref:Uncharacterized protein n=1 Tax=Vicia faba TaxID=3906 RepID=A0AAV1AB74_VICFA|nr:unnamed protein product [Vicia faba]